MKKKKEKEKAKIEAKEERKIKGEKDGKRMKIWIKVKI